MNKVFEIRTFWGGVYAIGRADNYGNIPKEITVVDEIQGVFDVTFTHGKFVNRIYGMAFARMGDQKVAEKLDKEQAIKFEQEKEERKLREAEQKVKQFSQHKKRKK